MKLSIVIPVFCNRHSLQPLIFRLDAIADALSTIKCEYLFVDDGSTDDSHSVLEELARNHHRIRTIRLSRNFGSEAAIIAGLSHSRADASVAISADLQDPPELLLSMLDAWKRGARIVIAARSSRNDGVVTNLTSWCFYSFYRTFINSSMPKGGFDCFLLDRIARKALLEIAGHKSYIPGLILWIGYSRTTIYYTRERRHSAFGKSGWSTLQRVFLFTRIIGDSAAFCQTLLMSATVATATCFVVLFISDPSIVTLGLVTQQTAHTSEIILAAHLALCLQTVAFILYWRAISSVKVKYLIDPREPSFMSTEVD